jgi:hypothetical protein
MASRKRRSRRPAASPRSGPGPRRLGSQEAPTPRSASADRRYQRTHRQGSSRTSWVVVGVVVVIVAVLVVVKLTGSSSPSGGIASGRHPAPVPTAVVAALENVPVAVYNSVGTGSNTDPFVEAKDQPSLTENGLPRVVYIGGEFCPYCAILRWSLVAALMRFGTFTGLKESSSSADVAPVPTFAFFGTKYTSKYVALSAYEVEDRNGRTLETLPKDVGKIFTKYGGGSGFPFLDIANQHVASGAPPFLVPSLDSPPISALAGAGTGDMLSIARAIADPTSTYGQSIKAATFDIEANFMTAAICRSDGGKPASVCGSLGVKAAEKVIAATKQVS